MIEHHSKCKNYGLVILFKNYIMYISEEFIKQMEGFVKKEINLSESHGFKVLGFFPYHSKSIRNNVRIPRKTLKELELILRKNGINDNKFVVVCKDIINFETEDFAINFKDFYAIFGRWEEIEKY